MLQALGFKEENLPKYEVAHFKNDEDVWEAVSFRELHREERRAELRTKELRDKPDGSYQLGIRNQAKQDRHLCVQRYTFCACLI